MFFHFNALGNSNEFEAVRLKQAPRNFRSICATFADKVEACTNLAY
jgi:hypothetical protein